MFTDVGSPSRLANNNLHLYSKVLSSLTGQKKPHSSECPRLRWEHPIPLNLTAPASLKMSQSFGAGPSDDVMVPMPIDSNNAARRKLESQKGGVRNFTLLIQNFYGSNSTFSSSNAIIFKLFLSTQICFFF